MRWLVVDGLRATADVDDAQARVAETDAGLDVVAVAIGAAMRNGLHHPLQTALLRRPLRVEIKGACYATHAVEVD